MRAFAQRSQQVNDVASRPSPSGPLHLARPQPATRVIAGAVPDPLLSSRSRGWSGLTLELHSFHELDAVVQPTDHVIAIHLGGNVNLRQTRNRRTRTRRMTRGDIAITPVGPATRWQQSSHSLVVLLRLSPEYVRTVAGDEYAMDVDGLEIQTVFSTRDDVIENLGRRLLAGLELEGGDSHLYVDTLSCELALRLLGRYTSSVIPKIHRATLSSHKLRRVMEHIDENLCNQLTLARMANAVALSPGHFAHAFREATGVAPHRYVLERRVEHAKELLRQSDLPITEISSRVGCSSHSHFSALFSRVTGLTPREFRALA